MVRKLVWVVWVLAATVAAQAQAGPQAVWKPPKVLIVVAHPDDEVCFAATTYRLVKELGGAADQLVITDGEGGFRYSLLAEPYYGVKLTDEAVGRAALPAIRKHELEESGKVLGIAHHYYLDQKDEHYTQDEKEVLDRTWDRKKVLAELEARLRAGDYDFVFTLFPFAETHGAHKAATVLALEAAGAQPVARRPIVLGCADSNRSDAHPPAFAALAGYPETAPLAGAPVFQFDRAVKFGFRNALDYQIIVNWVIAAHKSQGLFQTLYNKDDTEDFVLYAPDGAAAVAKTQELFEKLKR